MCIKPVYLKNPNKGRFSNDPVMQYVKDVHSDYIPISCGHCPACLALKQNYFIQRFEMECLISDAWTGMLSYNNEHLPRLDINGYKHSYADSRDVQLLIKRLRNDEVFPKDTKFWFISERGTERHRPHWHFLIFTPKVDECLAVKLYRERVYFQRILDRWYYNKGSKRKPVKSPLLTYKFKNGKRNYDFHYVNPSLTDRGSQDVAFYTSKYYLKEDKYTQRLHSALKLNLGEEDYKLIWALMRPKHLSSHYIGDFKHPLISDYLTMCYDFSLQIHSPYPLFINPVTGQTFPLSPYYRKIFDNKDLLYAFAKNANNIIDGVRISDYISVDDVKRKYQKFNKIIDRINLRDLDFQQLINSDYGTIYQNPELFKDSEILAESPSSHYSYDDFSFTDF